MLRCAAAWLLVFLLVAGRFACALFGRGLFVPFGRFCVCSVASWFFVSCVRCVLVRCLVVCGSSVYCVVACGFTCAMVRCLRDAFAVVSSVCWLVLVGCCFALCCLTFVLFFSCVSVACCLLFAVDDLSVVCSCACLLCVYQILLECCIVVRGAFVCVCVRAFALLSRWLFVLMLHCLFR